jgi:hypothetical protein
MMMRNKPRKASRRMSRGFFAPAVCKTDGSVSMRLFKGTPSKKLPVFKLLYAIFAGQFL